MDKKQKDILLKKINLSENGDIAKNDEDLEKSLLYQTGNERKKRIYKEFYDDIKLDVKEDW